MARVTKKVVTEVEQLSREEVEVVFKQYAEAESSFNKLQAELELKITELRSKYQEKLAGFTGTMTEEKERLELYAMQNKDLFTLKRSQEFTHGWLGFRTCPPSVKTIKGFTMESVKNLLKRIAPNYLRVKEEVDKDTLLADADKLGVEKLAEFGLKVSQDEIFEVTTKKESEKK